MRLTQEQADALLQKCEDEFCIIDLRSREYDDVPGHILRLNFLRPTGRTGQIQRTNVKAHWWRIGNGLGRVREFWICRACHETILSLAQNYVIEEATFFNHVT